MRSIKRQRDVLEKINSADKVNSNESRLLGYLVLTEDYPELLDWVERARKNMSEMEDLLRNYEYCALEEKEEICACVMCAAEKLLEELPDE